MKIVEEFLEIRRETVELVKKAVGEERKAYVLVNNSSEGNAGEVKLRMAPDQWLHPQTALDEPTIALMCFTVP